jgi:hypothetical protein
MKHAACLAVLLAAQAAGAQPLGRLFTTPDERLLLDQARAASRAPPAPPPQQQAAPPVPVVPLTVNGFVRSSSGRSTVWVNEAAQEDERNSFKGSAGKPTVALRLPSGRKVELKAGQTIDPDRVTVRDVYPK